MRNIIPGLLLAVLLSTAASAQRMYRPSAHSIAEAPDWAKKMYGESPNRFEVERAYRAYYEAQPFEKSYHTQYYKRWRRAVAGRTAPDGSILPLSEAPQPPAQRGSRAGDWSLMGPLVAYNTAGQPTGQQANIYCIAQSPSAPQVLYCGSETGECYRSADGGQSWANISLGLAIAEGVSAIAVHPADPNTVYAGAGSQVWKSNDGGQNWAPSLYEWQLYPNEIWISPLDPDVLLVAADRGLFRSSDGGANWAQLYADRAYDVKANVADPATVYVLKNNPALGICQFLRSADSGATFSVQGAGWFASSDPARHDGGARLATTAADPQRLYAYLIGEAKAGDNGYIGVFRSDDGGDSWTLPNGPAGGPYSASHPNLAIGTPSWQYHQGFYNCAIMASDSDPDQIRVGGLNLYGSDDGGATFYPLAGYVGGPYDIHVDMQDFRSIGNTTWITTDGGIYRSDDFFNSANYGVRMQGIHSADYWGFGSGWNEDVLIGGLYHNGNLSFHENYGAGQFLQLGGGEPASGYVNQGENRRVYSSDIGGKIVPLFIGEPVQDVGFGISPNESYYAVESSELEFDPRCYAIAYTGKEHQLWRSRDKGASFELLATFGNDPAQRITYIELSRSAPGVIYVCQQGLNPAAARLWRSSDEGATWASVALPPVPNSRRMLLQLDPSDHLRLWVAFADAPNGQKVFGSADGGASWANLSGPALNGHEARSLSHVGGTDGGLYLATDQGIFYRNAQMSDWADVGDGLPVLLKANILRPFYRDGKLRVATYGKGIWESPFHEAPAGPIAQIMADRLEAVQYCDSVRIRYVDHSMLRHEGATWEWHFEGGSPASADTWQAEVAYPAGGTFLTTLSVSDANGAQSSDSLYVQVSAYEPPSSLAEGFEGAFPPPAFFVRNPDEGITWEQAPGIGGFGTSGTAMRLRGYDYWPGGAEDDALFSLDLGGADAPMLRFDVAYARYAVNYSDSLEVLVSTDCGASYTSLYFKGGSDLATAPDYGDAPFVPTPAQWRSEAIDLSAFAGAEALQVVFRSHTGWGQNIYVDNIQLEGGSSSASPDPAAPAVTMGLFPNPLVGQQPLWLHSSSPAPLRVELYASNGKRIYRETHRQGDAIALPDLPAGVYIYVLTGERLIHKGRLVVVEGRR